MMMKRWLLMLICCAVQVLTGRAQHTVLNFLDEATGQPVSFVSVFVCQKGEWLTADSVGVLQIAVHPASGLEISRVGYHTLKLPAAEWSATKETSILLKPLITVYAPATVEGLSLESILSKVRKRISESVDTLVVANSFYRQYHVENGKPVFMVEADAQVLFPRRSGREEQLKILHVRRMKSVEKNPDQHSDHFVDLLLMNPVAHPEGSLLNRYVGHNIRWREEVTPARNGTDQWMKLEYERLSDDRRFSETGAIVYDAAYRLMAYNFTRRLNPGWGPEYDRFSGKYAWLKLEETVACAYDWKNNLITLSSIQQQYTHLLFHSVFHVADYELTEDFRWESYGVRTGMPADKAAFKLQSNLYDHGVKPDPAFFDQEYLMQFSPVDAAFVNLFESPDALIQQLTAP